MAQPNGSVKAALSYLDAHLADFQDQLVDAQPHSRRLRRARSERAPEALGRGHRRR